MNRLSINLIVAAAVGVSMASSASAQGLNPFENAANRAKPKSGIASFGDSISSGFKKGWNSLSKPFEPSSNPDEADPTKLVSPGKPSVELYMAVARSYETKGLAGEAEQQYQEALKHFPDNCNAMLGYGRFLNRQHRAKEAIKLYQQAAQKYPDNSGPWNDLGLCLASNGEIDQAAEAMEQAIRIEPKRALFRNNMAIIKVEQGHRSKAFVHLRAVYDEATSYYNLGHLLQKQGDSDAALAHFKVALQRNPDLKEAQVWIQRIQATRPQRETDGLQLARRPETPQQDRRSFAPRQESPNRFAQPPRVESGMPSQVDLDRRSAEPARSQSQTPLQQNPPFMGGPRPGIATEPEVYRWPSQAVDQPRMPQGPSTPPSQQAGPYSLQQPAGAILPARQETPSRLTGPLPDSSRVAPRLSDRQTDAPPSSNQDLRWGALVDQAGQARSTAGTGLPNSQPLPANERDGVQDTNVVYPLPPVEASPRGPY